MIQRVSQSYGAPPGAKCAALAPLGGQNGGRDGLASLPLSLGHWARQIGPLRWSQGRISDIITLGGHTVRLQSYDKQPQVQVPSELPSAIASAKPKRAARERSGLSGVSGGREATAMLVRCSRSRCRKRGRQLACKSRFVGAGVARSASLTAQPPSLPPAPWLPSPPSPRHPHGTTLGLRRRSSLRALARAACSGHGQGGLSGNPVGNPTGQTYAELR